MRMPELMMVIRGSSAIFKTWANSSAQVGDQRHCSQQCDDGEETAGCDVPLSAVPVPATPTESDTTSASMCFRRSKRKW